MADTWFVAKEWKARLVEFAGRRMLRNVANGETTTYDVSRSEGQVSQEGDAFNTKNMNDLEQRVANGFADAKTAVDTLSRDLGRVNVYVGGDGKLHFVNSGGADSVIPFSTKASSGKLIKQFYGIGTGQGAEGYVTNTYQISQSDKNSSYKCYMLTVSTVYINSVTWEGCDISISNGGKKISETVYDGISVSNGSLGSVRGMRLKTFVWMLPGDAPVGSIFTIRARGIFIGQIIGIL